jgi:hypothetical protein
VLQRRLNHDGRYRSDDGREYVATAAVDHQRQENDAAKRQAADCQAENQIGELEYSLLLLVKLLHIRPRHECRKPPGANPLSDFKSTSRPPARLIPL